jgi:hypothetical protein
MDRFGNHSKEWQNHLSTVSYRFLRGRRTTEYSSIESNIPGGFMKRIPKVVAASVLVLTVTGVIASAQDHRDDHHDQHDNHQYVRHDEWKKGARMNHDDWTRGEQVDYRRYHLHAPPRGYEWREVDGNYVMAAVATGAIASVIAASAAH